MSRAGRQPDAPPTPPTGKVFRVLGVDPGLHITAMGSDSPGKNELHPDVLERADRVVCDRRAQCEQLGELRSALGRGLEIETVELGEVITGAASGRTRDDQITVADLTGTGIQDTAIALFALERARAAGAGSTLEA